MAQEEIIKQFEAQQVRVVWDDEQEKYFFSIVDVIRVLTESADYQTSRKYWNKVKQRLVEEGNEPVTNCHQLKLTSHTDGKKYLTDVADIEQILRIIQSVPSKKAEPIKMWLAQVAKRGGKVAKDARRSVEKELGHSVVSSKKAIDYIQPKDELPFSKKNK